MKRYISTSYPIKEHFIFEGANPTIKKAIKDGLTERSAEDGAEFTIYEVKITPIKKIAYRAVVEEKC